MKFTKAATISMVTLVGMTIALPLSAMAADPTPANTTADLVLEPGDDTIVNPPIDPIEPPTGATGDLTIDAVSNFQFDTHKIDTATATYTATAKEGSVLGLQVTDKRGTGEGWNLSAKISTAFSDGTHDLKGAALSLPVGTLKTNNADQSNPPVSSALALNDQEGTVLNAPVDQGMGSWAEDFADGVKLVVPAGNYAGTYQAGITWTLTNAPK
ncbi:WxL domain-containing protein [Carnobacterium gallinarum]|uniref:WxL domain-containing protein n=1 Tax=Carnobacterium gallinarum TaxID=2749 RepID=UPI00054EA580|nr:WxL domain-containing protein [Carnobacterium gallinarum]